jgi:hypothetical protein
VTNFSLYRTTFSCLFFASVPMLTYTNVQCTYIIQDPCYSACSYLHMYQLHLGCLQGADEYIHTVHISWGRGVCTMPDICFSHCKRFLVHRLRICQIFYISIAVANFFYISIAAGSFFLYFSSSWHSNLNKNSSFRLLLTCSPKNMKY